MALVIIADPEFFIDSETAASDCSFFQDEEFMKNFINCPFIIT